jgi:hypothetical protein
VFQGLGIGSHCVVVREKMENLIAAIIFGEEEDDDLLVYCMIDIATDISVKGKMKDTISV